MYKYIKSIFFTLVSVPYCFGQYHREFPPVEISRCEGDTILLWVNKSIHNKGKTVYRDDCTYTVPYNVPNFEELTITGGPYQQTQEVVGDNTSANGFVTIKVVAVKSTVMTITTMQRIDIVFEGRKCNEAVSSTLKDTYTYIINVYKKDIKPDIRAITTPGNGGGPEKVQIAVQGCETGDFITWRPYNGSIFQTTADNAFFYNPYDCTEYEVSCSNRFCPKYESKWSGPVIPANYFNRKNNLGYDPDFSQFLENQAIKSIGKPEYGYRRQYSCIQRKSSNEYARTGENGWAGGFVKHLFDEMANDKPCEGSANYECLIKNQTGCFFEAGNLSHGLFELLPGFSSYRPTDSNPIDALDKWNSQHEGFLINAVATCFNELDQDLHFTGSKGIYNDFVGIFARRFRGMGQIFYGINFIYTQLVQLSVTQNVPINSLNQIYNELPPIATREQLFTQKVYDDSEIKVNAENLFFLKTNTSVQINTLANNLSSPVTYQLDVNPSIATITQNGLLTIHSTGMPMVNERMPLRITVTSGTTTGIGQFAIYDNDNDGDFLADTYELKVGLNPNVKNDLKSDLDGDDLLDIFEVNLGSDPLKKDTDGDGFNDLEEYLRNTSPTNINSFPVTIHTITSGNWSSPSTWSCSCIPTQTQDVQIKVEHTVVVDTPSANARSILIEGRIQFSPGSNVKIR